MIIDPDSTDVHRISHDTTRLPPKMNRVMCGGNKNKRCHRCSGLHDTCDNQCQ